MSSHSIAVVIPTVGRIKSLRRTLKSITKQTRSPNEIIIVDDGDISDEHFCEIESWFSPETRVVHTQSDPSEPMGLSNARNRGAEVARSEVVLFLDDDVELREDYISNLDRLYSEFNDPYIAGVGGFDSSLRSKSKTEQIYDRIFGLSGDGWSVNSLGIQSWTTNIEEPVISDWQLGNNCSYRRDILLEYPFKIRNGGRESLEDVFHGLELKQNGYNSIIAPQLELDHHEEPDLESNVEYGVKYGKNRTRIFQEYSSSSIVLFVWAAIGESLRHIIAPMVDSRWKFHLTTAVGFLYGVLAQMIRGSQDH